MQRKELKRYRDKADPNQNKHKGNHRKVFRDVFFHRGSRKKIKFTRVVEDKAKEILFSVYLEDDEMEKKKERKKKRNISVYARMNNNQLIIGVIAEVKQEKDVRKEIKSSLMNGRWTIYAKSHHFFSFLVNQFLLKCS